jgi:uncharacterized membrane protein HdeD (DUF308 family)
MISENEKYLKESRSLIEKAFDFENYIFRRAFGLYYLGWAVAFFLYTLPSLDYLVFSSNKWILPAFSISSSVIIMLLTGFIINKAFKVSRVFKREPKWSDWRIFILFFFLIIFVLTIFSITGFVSYFALLYVFLALLVPSAIVSTVKKSMTKFNPETWVALISFIIACLASIAGIESGIYSILTVTWIIVAIAWAACGIAGIYNAYFQSVVIIDDE